MARSLPPRLPKLILYRGLPGSGKSTAAKSYVRYLQDCGAKAIHVEADMYFIQPGGSYKFDPEQIKEAHTWCQKTAQIYINSNYIVCVANPFIEGWELEPYMAMTGNYKIYHCVGHCTSVHDVPPTVIQKMLNRFESIPEEEIYHD